MPGPNGSGIVVFVHPMNAHPFVSTLVLGLALAACDRAPSDVREWTQADHEQPEGAPTGRPAASAGVVGAKKSGADPDLVELAWQTKCAGCHGPRGRGDGPDGPMVRAPDLTRAEWQARVTDEELASTIRKGRNKMPAFDRLPEAVVSGLVKRIRASRSDATPHD